MAHLNLLRHCKLTIANFKLQISNCKLQGTRALINLHFSICNCQFAIKVHGTASSLAWEPPAHERLSTRLMLKHWSIYMTRLVRCLLVVSATFVPVGFVVADEKADIERIVSLGRSDNRVMDHLDNLCNRFGPRLTGSDNLQNASDWARESLSSFGLEDARLEEWGQYAVGFNRGPWFGRMIKPSEKPLTFGTNAWSAGTKGVQRGPAVFAPQDEEELASVRDRLPGAWVLMRRPGSNTR